MVCQKKRVLSVLAVSAVMAVLRAVVVVNNMEKNIYENDTYYLPETFFVKTFDTLSIVIVLVFTFIAVSLLFSRRTVVDPDSRPSPASMLVLSFVLFFGAGVCGKNLFLAEGPLPVLETLTAALAALCGIAFLILGMKNETVDANTFSLITILPITFSAFRLVESFIESNAAPLASSGDYRILGLVSALLFFLYEGKSHISEKTAVFISLFGYLSLYFLLVYSFNNLVLHCFGAFAFDSCAAYSVVDAGIVFYIASRLFNVKISRSIKEV